MKLPRTARVDHRVGAARALLHACLDARDHRPIAAALGTLRLPRALRTDDDLMALAALAMAETFGWIGGARAAGVRAALRAALAGAADDAVAGAGADTVLAWSTAAGEWCEREGLDEPFSRLQPRAAAADARAQASWRVHWRIASAWHHESFGRRHEVVPLLQEAGRIAGAAGDAHLKAAAGLHLARLALAHRDAGDALEQARRALEAAGGEADAPLTHADAADVAARVALARGDFHAALHQARRCHALAQSAGATPAYCVTYRLNEAYALAGLGDFADAVRLTSDLAAVRQPVHLAERLDLLARLLELMRAQYAGEPTDRDALAAVVRRLRELQWPGVLAVLPLPLARLWAQALQLRVEPRWIAASIRGRDLPPPALCWPAAWPWAVRIEVLGAFSCRNDTGSIVGPAPTKAASRPLELLRRVAVQGGFEGIAVDVLAAALWPGEGREGRTKAFEVTLARARKLLGAADALMLNDRRVRLNPRRVWLDRVALEAELDRVLACRGADPARRRAHWNEALALWRGPLLADAAPAPWIDAARQRLRSRLAAALLTDAPLEGHRARCLRALAADPGIEPLLAA